MVHTCRGCGRGFGLRVAIAVGWVVSAPLAGPRRPHTSLEHSQRPQRCVGFCPRCVCASSVHAQPFAEGICQAVAVLAQVGQAMWPPLVVRSHIAEGRASCAGVDGLIPVPGRCATQSGVRRPSFSFMKFGMRRPKMTSSMLRALGMLDFSVVGHRRRRK